MSTLTTRLLDGPSAALELEEAELKVVAGPDRGTMVDLGSDSLVIGSGSTAGMVLHDPTVSSRHAEISISKNGYMIRDLGSTNGIRSGQIMIEKAQLSDGMRLELGESALSVRSKNTQKTLELSRAGKVANLIAHSVKMRVFVGHVEKLAPNDVTVLLEGETGTGKEVAAQAIHHLSNRRSGPFVVFDCAAISKSLAMAELFGYEKGAFTGADMSRKGLIEEADGGTLFIDEVGELPLELQPMLLGAIERRSSRRVGGKNAITHDIRIIAATNRNLQEEVRAGRFREDLFFRLAVVRVHLPPLRERREDIPLLLDAFARELGVGVSPDVLGPFEAYDWPGNVRELRNIVQRMVSMPAGVSVPSSGAPPAQAALSIVDQNGTLVSLPDLRRRTVDDLERRYIEEALRRAKNNLSKAAEFAGISRQAFTMLAEKHGLHPRG